METVDTRANRLGVRQRGRATRAQLREVAGVAPATIRRRLRDRTWTEPAPNVIDLGTHPRTWESDAVTLLLAAGPGAAWVSHDAAAWLHRFLDAPRPAAIDVLVLRGRKAVVGGVRLHTTRRIGRDELTTVAGLGCTTRERTLLDLAARTAPDVLERWVADLERRHRGTTRRVLELTDRHRNTPGRRRLLTVIDRLPAGVGRLGSPLEVFAVQRLRELQAPPFTLQHVVRDAAGARIKRVDVAWVERRTVLELDGAAYHDLSQARVADAATRDALRAAGWRVQVARRHDLDGPEFAAFVRSLGDVSRSR